MLLSDILSPRERNILIHLSNGLTNSQIVERLKIRLDCLYVHCQHIRKKTGIKNTRNQQECRDYVKGIRHDDSIAWQPPLSWTQLEVIHLLSMGDSYKSISSTLSMKPQTAQNHASEACKRAGIHGLGRHARLQAIRDYISRLEQNGQHIDPML